MKKKQPTADIGPRFNKSLDSFGLGPAYLDYCVKKGWLTKNGEGETAQYELTDLGRRKLDNVSLNFDLSAILSKGQGPKKKRKRHKK
jgi:DNA-binding PadR family transcriptional regulator